MEEQNLSNNIDLLCVSTTIPNILKEAELTPRNENPENDVENYNDADDASIIYDPSEDHHVNDSKQSDFQNIQFDHPYLRRTKNILKSEYNIPCDNPSYISGSSVTNYCDNSEVDSFHKIQGSNPLFVSNCVVNSKINNDKGVYNDNDVDLMLKSENCVKMYNNCANSDIQSLTEISSSNIYKISQNIGDDSNLRISYSGLLNSIGEINTLSGKIKHSNDSDIDKTNTRKKTHYRKTHYRNCSLPLKKVTFERQESHLSDRVPFRGTTSHEFRRLSRTRLSQWGFSRNIPPVSRQTSLPIVEGVNDQHLWSEAKSLQRPALLVLWWALLAVIMYILSLYDLWSDCSVAYLFYQIKEYNWCYFSMSILVLSYSLQCFFSYYEVTHAVHHHFGLLSTKKYAISLFLLMPWIILCIGIYDTYKNKYTRRLQTAYIMMFIEVIFENLAQTSLQLNAICVYAHKQDKNMTSIQHKNVTSIQNMKVTPLQWVSVSSSILFLSVGISYSVIFYNNKEATHFTKNMFCIFGGVTVVSRLLLCSSWALQNKYLWALPFVAGMVTTAMTWFVLRTYSRFGYKEFLNRYDINNIPMALVTSSSWVTSFIFNCFSPSGIPVSVLMCMLAWVDFSMKREQESNFDSPLPVINICLTKFVLICNLVFSFVPKYHILSKTWVEGEGEDEDDPYHFRFY